MIKKGEDSLYSFHPYKHNILARNSSLTDS